MLVCWHCLDMLFNLSSLTVDMLKIHVDIFHSLKNTTVNLGSLRCSTQWKGGMIIKRTGEDHAVAACAAALAQQKAASVESEPEGFNAQRPCLLLFVMTFLEWTATC